MSAPIETVSPPAALFLGHAELADFQPALAWLRLKTTLACSSLRAVLEQPLDAAASPEWIVLGQSRDGEFSTRDIVELRRRWPLARCVVMVGSWGEGEQAKQKVCLGAWRAAWHQFIPRAAEQLACRAAGRPGPWDRPLTTADDERNEIEAGSLHGLRVALVAARADDADNLAECLAACGADCRRGMPAVPSVDAVVWVNRLPPEIADAAIAQECPMNVARGVIVLTDFPRSGDWPRLLARGGGALLGRPVAIADLASLLRELAGRSEGSPTPSSNLH